jgi:CheY-like chemotaxis protein
MKVLIAEDNLTFQLILGGPLKKQGHDVTAVESGLHAWNAYQTAYFPVVITDWQMPEMDGMALMRRVRAKPYEKYTYVIMIATKGGKQSYLEAMKAGADDLMAKPPRRRAAGCPPAGGGADRRRAEPCETAEGDPVGLLVLQECSDG